VCEGASLLCVSIPGITVLVDEVELGGDPPTVLRRPGSEVVEPAHGSPHPSDHGADPAPALTAHSQGGV
jgi:hypothetical protein